MRVIVKGKTGTDVKRSPRSRQCCSGVVLC